jgi:hypothetical protein
VETKVSGASGRGRRRVAVCIVASLCLSLAAAPAGTAAGAKKKAPERAFAGPNGQGLASWVQLDKHGKTATVVVAFGAECSASGGALLWTGAKVPVKKGRFAYERTEDANGPAIQIQGKIGKSAATGTFHVSYQDPTTPGSTCDSGQVSFRLPIAGYGGQLSGDGYPIALTFNKKKTSVREMKLVVGVNCQSGSSFAVSRTYTDFDLTKSGSFGDEFDDDASEIQADPHPTFHVSFDGKLGKTKASGTFRLTAVMKDAQGNQVDTCDSGVLKWSALM